MESSSNENAKLKKPLQTDTEKFLISHINIDNTLLIEANVRILKRLTQLAL